MPQGHVELMWSYQRDYRICRAWVTYLRDSHDHEGASAGLDNNNSITYCW